MKSAVLKHRIDLPAGGRPMSKDDSRPEYVGRKDFFQLPEALQAASKGIEFGLMLVATEKYPSDFDPASLGAAYGVHAANETMTQLYAAHLKGDAEAERDIFANFERWASWNPVPDYVTLHMGGTGKIPERLDTDRMNVIQSPEEILLHLRWLRITYRRILDILPPASLENIAKDQYVGPPRWDFGSEWVGMTYQEDRRGIGPDIAYVLQDTSGRATFDLEHWTFSKQALEGSALEYQGLVMPKVWELSSAGYEIYNLTGLLYVQGKPVGVPVSISDQDIIRQLRPKTLHVGGIHPAVIQLTPGEADNLYHRHLKNVLPPEVWAQVSLRRVGSHASIREDDEALRAGVVAAIKCGAEISCLEVASFGEAAPKDDSSPGCWYWQPENALEESFKAYCRMLPDLCVLALL